jgi:DsbE subfamily thiol:disulfide oxidoreductase
MRILFLIPIVIFSALIGFFAFRLILIERGDTPDKIPSVMIGKPAPTFDLPALLPPKPGLKTDDLQGKVTLINFFMPGCAPCRAEHPLLMEMAGHDARLAGINFKSKPADAEAWLQKVGNPYDAIGSDEGNKTAIDFGVYGVPETYLIDKHGIIRFKQIGPLTPDIVRDKLLPMMKELNR